MPKSGWWWVSIAPWLWLAHSLIQKCMTTRTTTSCYRFNPSMGIGSDQSVLKVPVRDIKGIGPSLSSKLQILEIKTLGDLLFHLPNSFLDRRRIWKISDVVIGEYVTVKCTVQRCKDGVGYTSPNKVFCIDGERKIEVTYFTNSNAYFNNNWSYLKSTVYREGQVVLVCGKVSISSFSGNYEIKNPDVAINFMDNQGGIDKFLGVEPIYPLTKGLTSIKLASLVDDGLQAAAKDKVLKQEWISKNTMETKGWPTFVSALQALHKGACDPETRKRARERLAFEELFACQLREELALQQSKALAAQGSSGQEVDYSVKNMSEDGRSKSRINDIESSNVLASKLRAALPFRLTTCQETAVVKITEELESSQRMVHLVQGDVGSGKTMVAMMAMLRVVESGGQAALLAPTDLLAQQHLRVIQQCLALIGAASSSSSITRERTDDDSSFSSSQSQHLQAALITAAVKGRARTSMLKALKSGDISVVVGTHALLTEPVLTSFRSLALVVVDEEQRFGVAQRALIADRTNVLYTTATPIPRSLTRFVQDGCSLSTLRTKLPSKRAVQTVVLGTSAAPLIVKRIGANIDFGTKVFWVCPCLSPSERMAGSSATERFAQLDAAFPGRVALLHGRMSAAEKEAVMARFAVVDGEVSVLVSTTVVEVGIDVPDASICIIDRADYFGLSQIHQIRGRIGRGSPPPREILKNCSCLLLFDDSADEALNSEDSGGRGGAGAGAGAGAAPWMRRLEVLTRSNDCFEIAEWDLQFRGPGDVFGLRQHGAASYKFASDLAPLADDASAFASLLVDAREAARRVMEGRYGGQVDEARIRLLLDLFAPLSTSQAIGVLPQTTITAEALEEAPALHPEEAQRPYSPLLGSAVEEVQMRRELSCAVDDDVGIKVDLEGAALESGAKVDPLGGIDVNVDGVGSAVGAGPVYIVFDLETTGLNVTEDRVIQMAAKVVGLPFMVFNAYIKPSDRSVSSFIEEFTGISNRFLADEGMELSEAWARFKCWLRLLKGPGPLGEDEGEDEGSTCGPKGEAHVSDTAGGGLGVSRPLVLIAHNGKRFDFPLMAAEVARLRSAWTNSSGVFAGDWQEEAGISGLMDSLPVLRDEDMWQDFIGGIGDENDVDANGEGRRLRASGRPGKFSLGALYLHCTGRALDGAHNALADVAALEEVLEMPTLAPRWRALFQKGRS